MIRGTAQPAAGITIRTVRPAELENLLRELVDLLEEVVRAGASLGFLPSLTRGEAWTYWLSLRPELEAGSRVLLAAYRDGRIVGSGQLALSPWANSPHRAEAQKLFVGAALRGQALGRALMEGLHESAREHGRSLILLYTRRGGLAEPFYQALGYREAGVVPGHTLGPAGERQDSALLFRDLSS
jgi:GNAT superfamily N-acetyltransferase